MAKSFDDLIEFLLEEIALRGEQGASPSDFKELLQKFYDNPEGNEEPDNDKSNGASTPQPHVDRRLQEKVWTWLTAHPDITLGKQLNAEIPSLSDLESRENADPPAVAEADADAPQDAALKLFVTEERMWQAITGHGVDLRKVPRHEFIILSIIAAHGDKGVIQPEITRISGQDKRSVPKRTDNLMKNGYIVKTAVLAKGTRTSLCTLKRYAQRQTTEAEPVVNIMSSPDEIAKALFVNGLLLYDRFFDILTELLRDARIIRIEDLKSRLGIRIKTWEMKALWRSTRRLEGLKLIKRVKAQLNRNSSKWYRCIKLLREPVPRDRAVFVTMGIKDADKLTDGDKIGESAYALDDDAEGEIDPDLEQEPSALGQPLLEGDNEVEEVQRLPPQWDPDRPTPNFLFDIVHAHGSDGATTANIRDQGMGTFYRRPVDSILGRLSDIWHISQPAHLRHWAIIRDTGMNEKYIHYVYRTYENFARAVEKDEAAWEVVITQPVNPNQGRSKPRAKEKPTKDKIEHGYGELDEWGFPSIHPSKFQGKDGTATLADCNKAIAADMRFLPNRGHKPRFLVNPAAALLSREGTIESSPGPGTNVDDEIEGSLEVHMQKPRKKYTPRGDKPIGRPRKYALGKEPYNSGNLKQYRKIRALRAKAEQIARQELIKEKQDANTAAGIANPTVPEEEPETEPVALANGEEAGSADIQRPVTPDAPPSKRPRLETDTPMEGEPITSMNEMEMPVDATTTDAAAAETPNKTPTTAKGKGKATAQGAKRKQPAKGKNAEKIEKQTAELLGIDETMIDQRAEEVIVRLKKEEEERANVDFSRPGVYVNPPGAQKPRDPLHKGRPKKSFIVVITLEKLKGVNLETEQLGTMVEAIIAAKQTAQPALPQIEDMDVCLPETPTPQLQPGQVAGKRLPGNASEPVEQGPATVENSNAPMPEAEQMQLPLTPNPTSTPVQPQGGAVAAPEIAPGLTPGTTPGTAPEATPIPPPKKRGRPRKDPNAPPRPRKATKKRTDDTPGAAVAVNSETPQASPGIPPAVPSADEVSVPAAATPTPKRRPRAPKDPNAPQKTTKRKSKLATAQVPPETPSLAQQPIEPSATEPHGPVTDGNVQASAQSVLANGGSAMPIAQSAILPATLSAANPENSVISVASPSLQQRAELLGANSHVQANPYVQTDSHFQADTHVQAGTHVPTNSHIPTNNSPKHGPVSLWKPQQQTNSPYSLGLIPGSTFADMIAGPPQTPAREVRPVSSGEKDAFAGQPSAVSKDRGPESQTSPLGTFTHVQQRQEPTVSTHPQTTSPAIMNQLQHATYRSPYVLAPSAYISPYASTPSFPAVNTSPVEAQQHVSGAHTIPFPMGAPASKPLDGPIEQPASRVEKEPLQTAAVPDTSHTKPPTMQADDHVAASESDAPPVTEPMEVDEPSCSVQPATQDVPTTSADMENSGVEKTTEQNTGIQGPEVREELQTQNPSADRNASEPAESQAEVRTSKQASQTPVPVNQAAKSGVFPDPSLFNTPPKRRKGKWLGGKKQGVKLTSGGILNYNRTKLLVSIIQECDGVFPGDFEIQRPFIELWHKQHGEDRLVDRDTIKRTVKNAIDSGKIRRLTYTFKNKSGVMMNRHILTTPDKSPTDPLVLETQRKVIAAWPRQYTPKQMREYEHEIGNSWYGGLYEKETELEVKKQSLPAWMEELNARASEASKKQEQQRREKAAREGRGIQPLITRHVVDNVRRGRGGRPRLNRLPQEPTADVDFGPWTAFQSNFYVSEDQPQPHMDEPVADPDRAIEEYTGSFSLNEFVTDQAAGPDAFTDDEGGYSSTYTASTPSTPSTPRNRRTRSPSVISLGTPSKRPLAQKLQRRRMSFQFKNTTPASFDKDWEWQWITSMTDPGVRFFPTNGTFSTDYNSHRNARISLWVEPNAQHQQEFEENMPHSLEEIFASQRMKGKERDHNRRENPNLSRFERDLIKVNNWEELHRKRNEDLGLVLRQPHFINHVYYGEHLQPYDASFDPQWKHESSEMFTLREPPPFDEVDESDEEPKRKRTRHSVVERRASIDDNIPEGIPKPRRRRRRTAINTPDTRVVPSRKVAPQNWVRQPTADPLCVISTSDTKKLLYAIVVVQTLIGGVDKYTNWDAVRRAFKSHVHWDLTSFRNRWLWLRNHNREIIDRLVEEFQDAYLLAYECGDVPPLDYDDVENYDWEGIVAWAMENIVIKPPVKPVDTVTLPATREALEKDFVIEEVTNFTIPQKEPLFNENTLTQKRRELTERYSFSLPLTPPASPQHEQTDFVLERAKTWVRATIVAPDDQYNAIGAKEKLNTIGKKLIDRAVNELTATRLFRDEHKGRVRPGRAFTVDKSFLKIFERHLTVAQLLEAAKFKAHLDTKFQQGAKSVPLLPTAHDGHVLATLNLVSSGCVRVEPRLPPVNHKLGDPWPRLTKWGFTEGHYKTVHMERGNLNWGLYIIPTERYIFGNPLHSSTGGVGNNHIARKGKGKAPQRDLHPLPLPAQTGPYAEFIPLWYDIHANPIAEWWQRVVTAVVHVVLGRPGIGVEGVRRALKDALGAWEIELAVKWLREARVLQGLELGLGGEGETCEGLRLAEWWWMGLAE
ncbi:uncharacterized protein K452DRAFT_300754 [Aplosporella prunicola CBS 121167]|uniref:Uncharacterized protein n=1 Tax=Aplosporella prunicola CBS 121167 TaxID=1176127 RepID=A0A6A6B493_9PEZI|nr:uncharacterized protein K452DRAFT_300754 [Aplosporella prunicola CBS 121167]KAF2138656.1 hypothetical protein K452DRAFT_300754 [Aplosporella prunicola CBS 121167]